MPSEILIVYGYTRLDREQMITEDLSSYSLSYPKRMFLRKMNEYNYINRIALSIKEAGFRFDSITPSALSNIDLSNYKMILWLAGNEKSDNEIITQQEISVLEEFSGCLVLSGAQLTRFLWENYNQFLGMVGTSFNNVEAEPHSINLVQDFSLLSRISIDTGEGDTYPVYESDSLNPLSAQALGYYSESNRIAIAGLKNSGNIYLLFGFPIETIQDNNNRDTIIKDILSYCEIEENITEDELLSADEVWLSSSTKEVSPVCFIEKKPVASGIPGPHWAKMYQLFQEYKSSLK